MTLMLSKGARITSLCVAAVALFGNAFPVSAQESNSASSAATRHSYAPASTPSLPIFYDDALAAQGFPNPLVKVRIAGHEATFIVDSGASANVLADWYVKETGIPTSATASTAEGSGGKAAAERLVHRVWGEWSDGRRFNLDEAIVVAFPSYFQSLHLGGLMSPQLLAPTGMATVLDLKVPSLRFVPFARALSDLRRSIPSAALLVQTQLCRNAQSKLVNRVYLSPVTVVGVTEPMLIDTGATGTIFSAESRIAHTMESGSETGPASEGIGGKVNESRIVRNIQLLRGGRIVTLNPSIGEISTPCDTKGKLGMDALRSCLLILGDRKMAFSCG